MGVVRVIVILLRAFLTPRAMLVAENLALRHQLGVLQRSVKRPRLRQRDHIFWVWRSRLRADWQSSLVIVKPATVVRRHPDRLLRVLPRMTDTSLARPKHASAARHRTARAGQSDRGSHGRRPASPVHAGGLMRATNRSAGSHIPHAQVGQVKSRRYSPVFLV